MGRLKKLTVATTVATLVLVGIGGLVRASGSGLGCPSWPKCYGRWVPPFEHHALIEYSHRFAAAAAIVLICLQGVVAWRRYRNVPSLFVPSAAAVGLVFVQAVLGGIVVGNELEPSLVTLHFATAMALVATLVVAAVSAFRLGARGTGETPLPAGTARLARATLAGTGGLLLAGAYVRGREAGLAFRDWPLMGGRLVPRFDRLTAPHFAHRALAAGVAVALAVLAARIRREGGRRPSVRAFTWLAVALFAAQAIVGAAQVWTGLAPWSQVAHVVLSSLTWGSLVALVAAERRLATSAVALRRTRSSLPSTGILERARAYVQLTKPRIILLLLITTVPAMIVAARGWPSVWLMAATLAGGSIAAAGANTINCYLDRDIDEVMARTRHRPIPAHRVEPRSALLFGIALSSVSFAWLWGTVNLLSAGLALAAVLFYVFAYTIVLKRSTPQNIVIGGAAGAVACLVGWAATTGRLGAPAAVLFAIVFFWTPPHFWALAMRFASDYKAAGVPMMPVVRGGAETARQILLYSIVLVGVTLMLWPVAKMGAIYVVAAVGLGVSFLYHAMRLRREASARAALGLFKFSITYLALLFASMAADRLIRVS